MEHLELTNEWSECLCSELADEVALVPEQGTIIPVIVREIDIYHTQDSLTSSSHQYGQGAGRQGA